MSDENQVVVPPSFIALFLPPGRSKPTQPREHIARRHELCEDMACMLVDTARDKLCELGITEADVLQRIHRGLCGGAAGLDDAEAGWVTHRLAEILEWPDPDLAPP